MFAQHRTLLLLLPCMSACTVHWHATSVLFIIWRSLIDLQATQGDVLSEYRKGEDTNPTLADPAQAETTKRESTSASPLEQVFGGAEGVYARALANVSSECLLNVIIIPSFQGIDWRQCLYTQSDACGSILRVAARARVGNERRRCRKAGPRAIAIG